MQSWMEETYPTRDLELLERCHAVRDGGGPANRQTAVHYVFGSQELALMLDQEALPGQGQQTEAAQHC